MSALMYVGETMIMREKERSRNENVKMVNLASLLGISRIDGMPTTWVRRFCRVRKGVDERIDESGFL